MVRAEQGFELMGIISRISTLLSIGSRRTEEPQGFGKVLLMGGLWGAPCLPIIGPRKAQLIHGASEQSGFHTECPLSLPAREE